MHVGVILLSLLAAAAAIPASSETKVSKTAEPDFLTKQKHVYQLLENILGDLPYKELYDMGYKYEMMANITQYKYPALVKYFDWMFRNNKLQPKMMPFSVSLARLRKEVSMLTQLFMSAKDYQTFLSTAAWARVYLNQDQFVKAFSTAVINRPDMFGVMLPPAYEIFPHYFFDSKIIQRVQDYLNKYGYEYNGAKESYDFYINYTSSYLPYGEDKIAYFTEDIGLSTYYAYVRLAGYMLPEKAPKSQSYSLFSKNGHGAHYYYIHQQLVARYNLERLSQGLEPIKTLDYYYEHIETPYKPSMRHLNGAEFPSRPAHVYVTPRDDKYQLIALVRALERRIVDAIDRGEVMTVKGKFLSLYQPQGLNILGDLIEGTGRSVNPRYYGVFEFAAKQLYGYIPEFKSSFDYTPATLDMYMTTVKDPIFWQLYQKIMMFFYWYQLALPAYQYNDLYVPGVKIDKVDFSKLETYFNDFEVNLGNAAPMSVSYETKPGYTYPKFNAWVKRLNYKPYNYSVFVSSDKPYPGAVIRMFVGPKYNYDGMPIDFTKDRQYFYELDQFVYDLVAGKNEIFRQSSDSPLQSGDWPSVEDMKMWMNQSMTNKTPYNNMTPEKLFGFPARLSLPKGSASGFPVQFFFIVSPGYKYKQEFYDQTMEDKWNTYQPNHYYIMEPKQYGAYAKLPTDPINGFHQSIDVVPEVELEFVPEKSKKKEEKSEYIDKESWYKMYYDNKPMSEIIGGAVSFDGRPLGFPFDRPMGESAFYCPNMYFKDMKIYHDDSYFEA